MKKFGFTLAEVLLTIAIIGTVAALTAPTLVKSTRTSEFGAKLASSVSDFENANRTLLQERRRNSVTSFGSTEAYFEALSNYIKISPLQVSDYEIKTYSGGNYSQREAKIEVESESVNEEPKNEVELGNPVNGKPKKFSFNTLYPFVEIANNVLFQKALAAGPISVSGVVVNEEMASIANYQSYLSKNGVIYTVGLKSSGTPVGYVYVDVNGTTGANRLGVDVFLFELERNGSLTPFGANEWTTKCPDSGVDVNGEYCAASVIEHGWNIVYR